MTTARRVRRVLLSGALALLLPFVAAAEDPAAAGAEPVAAASAAAPVPVEAGAPSPTDPTATAPAPKAETPAAAEGAPDALAIPAAGAGRRSPTPPASTWRLNRFGIAVDAGLPDFAGATLLYRPLKFVRLGGALLYDYVGYGVRGGVTILPYFAIAPSLSVEAGHFFETNAAAKLEQRGVTIDANVRPVLERFGYTFANAQVGLEIGHPNWFVFYVRAGITRLWYTARGASQVAAAQQGSSTTRVTIADPSLRAQFPEAKVGFLFFIH